MSIAPKPQAPDRWKRAAIRLYRAVRTLAVYKDGKTLFEHPVTKNEQTIAAWLELNDAQREISDLIGAEIPSEGPSA